MSRIRDIAGEARFYIAGMKAVGMPLESVNSLNEYVRQLEEAGTILAPITVTATFTRLSSVREPVIEERPVVLYVTVYETLSGGEWIVVHMKGGPTGAESFVLASAMSRQYPPFPTGWAACFGAVDSWARCVVSAEEMHRALAHWGMS